MRIRFCLPFLGLLMILFSVGNSNGQNISYEFWPETDIWYKLTKQWRLSAYVPITKYNESKNRDLNVYLQADYAWGKTRLPFYKRLMDDNRSQTMKGWLARIGFMEGWSLGDHAESYSEDMLYAEIHKRLPIKGSVLLSQRFRPELRWLGEESNFSYRFRFRIMVEKEFTAKRSSIVPYINVEPYYDSRYTTVNRVRVISGTTLSWGPRFAYEGNITYQYDSHYDTENLLALNIILHVFFETKRAKRL